MLSLVERLTVKVDRDHAAALKAYREAVAAAGAGGEMSQKKIDELADAMTTLRLTPADFAADEATYRTYLIRKAVLDDTPTQAEIDRQINELVARQTVIQGEIEKLTKESNQNKARIYQLGPVRGILESGMNEFKIAHPRLFGPTG